MGDASASTTGREDPTLTIPQVVTLACNVYLFIYYIYIYIYIYIYVHRNTKKTHVYTHTHMRVRKQIPQPASFKSWCVIFSPGGLSILQLRRLLKSIAATFHGSLCGLTMTEFRPRNEEVPTESEAMKGQCWKHGWAFQKRCFSF